jgi:hypothetical protein
MKKGLFVLSILLFVSVSSIFAQITFEEFKDGSSDPSLADTYRSNVTDLLSKVNALLRRAGIYSADVRQGTRTETRTGAASYDGLHNYGRAIDIADPDGTIYKAVAPLIQGSNLRLENGSNTSTWVHLDIGREGVSNDVRGGRIFDP